MGRFRIIWRLTVTQSGSADFNLRIARPVHFIAISESRFAPRNCHRFQFDVINSIIFPVFPLRNAGHIDLIRRNQRKCRRVWVKLKGLVWYFELELFGSDDFVGPQSRAAVTTCWVSKRSFHSDFLCYG
jgi:hypothetical protein